MAYFVNILYNIHVDFQNMQLIVYIQYLFIFILYFVFHTQYDHGAQFCLEYNHDLHQKYKLVVSAQPGMLVFYCI